MNADDDVVAQGCTVQARRTSDAREAASRNSRTTGSASAKRIVEHVAGTGDSVSSARIDCREPSALFR
jgi:hypothetical protein